MKGRIGQLFINDDKISTYLCLGNYHSFFCPNEARTLEYNVQLHDENGEVIYNQMHSMSPSGSRSLYIREMLGDRCQIGMATCDFEVGNSHFFTYYLNAENQAMAIIHPQSTIGQEEQGEGWTSCQSIASRGIRTLRLYHANHSVLPAEVTYTLKDFRGGSTVAETSSRINPFSAGYVEFSLEKMDRLPELLSLETDKLPSPNGKPLIMREYQNNLFSMSHG